MKDTDILFSIALMILGIVLMYKSMKGNSCRQTGGTCHAIGPHTKRT